MQQLYKTPSGMGGSFDVVIVESVDAERVRVKVHMPRNPDWHGYQFTTRRDALTPIER